MKYITLDDLAKTIRSNIWKIPRDIDFIITIPRSGTICGSIISEFLNVPMIDINGFVNGTEPYGGGRIRYYNQIHAQKTNKVLVVDDTVFSGKSKIEAREKLRDFSAYTFIFMAVYLEGPNRNAVDFYLEDVSMYTNGFTELVLYEWNIFHHNEDIMEGCLYDMDGVLCLDPPDERNDKVYQEYIRNAIPLFVPTATIGGIATYRLVKNIEVTQKWLADNNVRYKTLYMFNANTWEERNSSGITPEAYKASIYVGSDKFKLFVESNAKQAKAIYELSGKPVLSIEGNVLYS